MTCAATHGGGSLQIGHELRFLPAQKVGSDSPTNAISGLGGRVAKSKLQVAKSTTGRGVISIAVLRGRG